jgi:hypothetical protein
LRNCNSCELMKKSGMMDAPYNARTGESIRFLLQNSLRTVLFFICTMNQNTIRCANDN